MQKLNTLEEQLMQAVWELKLAFPKVIFDKINNPAPYNTLLSTIRKLEKLGFLSYEKFGKFHRYFPLISKREYSKYLFNNFFDQYLNGSKEKLFSFFMEEENVDVEELEVLLNKLKKKDGK